jgi:hypothetical protein
MASTRASVQPGGLRISMKGLMSWLRARAGVTTIGVQKAAPGPGNTNPGGMTPTIRSAWPFSRKVLPSALGEARNALIQ